MGRPKKLTLDFFMHDAIARTDRKIRLLRKYHHNDGYATYFCLLEMVCQEEGMKLRLGDPMNDEFIADECDLRDVQQLYAIIETCCRLELLDRQLWQSERIVFSHGLHKRYVARLEQRRKDAIRKNSKADKAIAASLETHIREVEGSMPKPSAKFSARKTDESDRNTCGKPRDTESEVKTRDQRPEEKSKLHNSECVFDSEATPLPEEKNAAHAPQVVPVEVLDPEVDPEVTESVSASLLDKQQSTGQAESHCIGQFPPAPRNSVVQFETAFQAQMRSDPWENCDGELRQLFLEYVAGCYGNKRESMAKKMNIARSLVRKAKRSHEQSEEYERVADLWEAFVDNLQHAQSKEEATGQSEILDPEIREMFGL